MLKLNTSAKFKKDFKLCAKRGYDMELLQSAVDTLRIPARCLRWSKLMLKLSEKIKRPSLVGLLMSKLYGIKHLCE